MDRPTQQRPTGNPSEPPPNGRRAIRESALTERFGALLHDAPSCRARAPSPTVQVPVWRRL
eukprot:7780870-Alexandrium_andersonii.AAC.1